MQPPVAPMLAKLTRELPRAEGMFYEPKWDGFRCIVFRDGDEVELGSRNEKPLTRYFPELVEPLRRDLPDRCVLDGEIVIAGPAGLDFDALSQRIHPAESRITLLAGDDAGVLRRLRHPRRSAIATSATPLTPSAAGCSSRRSRRRAPPVHLTPATDDPDVAERLVLPVRGGGPRRRGGQARSTSRYLPDKRAMFKVKHERTADCVVAGFRWHKDGGVVGLAPARPLRRATGSSTTSAWPRGSPRSGAGSSSTSWSRSGPARPRAIRGWRAATAVQPGPGRHQPLERGQGHDLGAAAARAGLRGVLRPPPGATASVTARRSGGGGRTGSPPRAPTTSSRLRSPPSSSQVFDALS